MSKQIGGACVALAWLLAPVASADGPVISDVVARQRWPWSRLVDIDYILTCDATQRVDVAITARDGSTPLALPPESLSGDLYGVTHGKRRIVWDPTRTAYTNEQMLTQFSVTLAPSAPPLYMVIDLLKDPGQPGQIEYLYPGDSRLANSGRWTNVWFGVTNDSVYATDKLVMRRIPAGRYMMGDETNAVAVTLTRDFYVGVFEVTQLQYEHVTGCRPSYFNNAACYAGRPVEQVPYVHVRGGQSGTNWPAGNGVDATSFMGLLRSKTGVGGFDLPTEAQWEYACRAGTSTAFNDGNYDAEVAGPNAGTNRWLNALGRYKFDGGYVEGAAIPSASSGLTNGTAVVGSYQPNAWGLYDMHGNVWEWCLDWFSSCPEGGTDPSGAALGIHRVVKGGSWSASAVYGRSAARQICVQQAAGYYHGFRIVRNFCQ